MTRLFLVLPAVVCLAAPVVAQVPYSYPSPYGPIPSAQSFAPNYFNRNYQPLSPYLNLGNSTNPAAAYYYGVRPGTQGPTGLGPTFGSGAMMPPPVGRSLFLPPVTPAATADPNLFNNPQAPLPSPGGPVAYGNLNGSSRVGVGGPRSGFFGSGSGGGMGGTGMGSGSGSGSSGGIQPPKTPGNIPKVK